MNMEFRDAISSFLATQGRKSIEILKTAVRRIKPAGRPLSSIRSSSSRKRDPAVFAYGERLFSTFMNHLPGYAWIKSTDGSYVYINERVKQLLPFQHDCLGMTDEDLWPSELAAAYRANDLRVIATGEKVETVESFVLNGEQRYVMVTKFPIIDENGAIVMVGGTSVDITEHKRVEEALRESESFRRMIIESEPECVKLVAPDYTLLDMNPAGLGMIAATSREQVVGHSVLNLIAPESRSAFMELHQRVCHGESVVMEFEIVGLDGSRRWMESHAAPLLDKESRVIAQLAITLDVTERRRAEEALRTAEQNYRDIFENAAEGIFQTTPEGRFISANPALVKMFGFSSAEELIRERADISNEHYVDPKRREEFKRRLEEQGVVKGFELQAYRKDGSTILVSENVRAVRDEGGKVLYYEGTTQDITERRRTNHSLRLFRTLIDQSSDAIEVIDPETLRFLDCNESAYLDLGYSREEFLSHSVYDIDAVFDEGMAARLIQEIDRSGFVIFESIHRRKDGSTFPVEVNLKTVRLERDYRLAVVRDITERKRAEEALRGYSRQLIRAQEAERESIARELHDQIGQVLTAIRINLETIRASSNRTESTPLIDEGVMIVDEAIQQVRDLSFELRPSLLDDLGLTAALRWYADRYTQRTGIQTKTSICPESRIRLPRELETACFRVVQEALTNVARHAQAKNVSIDVRTMNGDLSLSITDDGIGFNVHSQTNGELLNSLGLRGMEERALALGGRLKIQSAPSKGTEIRAYFPNGERGG